MGIKILSLTWSSLVNSSEGPLEPHHCTWRRCKQLALTLFRTLPNSLLRGFTLSSDVFTWLLGNWSIFVMTKTLCSLIGPEGKSTTRMHNHLIQPREEDALIWFEIGYENYTLPRLTIPSSNKSFSNSFLNSIGWGWECVKNNWSSTDSLAQFPMNLREDLWPSIACGSFTKVGC